MGALTGTQRSWLLAVAVASIMTAANASEGAYFSQSWGWVTLAFLMPTAVVLILDRVDAPGRLRIAFVSLMGGLASWIALSASWSISAPASLREAERALVYVALALAIGFVLRRGDVGPVLGGVVLGVTLVCSYGLATRVLPDRFENHANEITGERLAEPLGYWNSLGVLAVIGIVTAVGLVAHGRRLHHALAAAAVLPVLASTLYFTFSRGSWGSLGVGMVATVALDPRRLRLVWHGAAVALPTVVCVAYASQQDALTTENVPAAAAEHEGHRLVVVILGAVIASLVLAWGARALAGRVAVSSHGRRVLDIALAAVAVAGVVALLVGLGAVDGFDRLERRFNAEPVTSVDLNDRLFSISGNGRAEELRVAWDAARERPVLGYGSGTYEYLWYERRPNLGVVRDAHSLYLETFAELGLVGPALLVALLLVLVAGAVRGRRQRFVAAGAGAFLAWAAASSLDWHWEMVGVTMAALLAGSGGLVAAERQRGRRLATMPRAALIALATGLSVVAVWSLVGNQALFAGREELAREDWSDARDDGRRAQDLLPWSPEPDLVVGDAAAGLGDRAGALRAYREAVDKDPRSWVAWLRLAQVARGEEREAAYTRVRELNPLEEDLPGG